MLAMTCMASCEVELPINTDTDAESLMAINALASPDTVVMANFTRVQSPNSPYHYNSNDDYFIEWRRLMAGDKNVFEKFLIRTGDVKLVVNESSTYQMTFDPKSMFFLSDYHPIEGDKLRIEANMQFQENENSKDDGYILFSASAETTIPSKVGIEMQDFALENSPITENESGSSHDPGLFGGTAEFWDNLDSDTLANISIRIKNVPNEKQYYRLYVRSCLTITHDKKPERIGYTMIQDTFSSQDPLLFDENVTASFGNVPKHFTPLFSNASFIGKDCTITVRSRLRSRADIYGKRFFIIELQTITPELYQYLKSYEYARVAKINDYFSDPTMLYTNVIGGFGIFGGVNRSNSIIINIPENN